MNYLQYLSNNAKNACFLKILVKIILLKYENKAKTNILSILVSCKKVSNPNTRFISYFFRCWYENIFFSYILPQTRTTQLIEA